MRTPRVSIPEAGPEAGSIVVLPDAEARHLAVVLRRRPGDRVVLLSARGGCFDGEIVGVEASSGGARVTVTVLGPSREAPALPVRWTVALAVVKGDDFDLAIRMAGELGLERIVPVFCERSVVRPDPRSARKLERWRRIAGEAAKQCGRAPPLAVDSPRLLGSFLAEPGEGSRWIAIPGAPWLPGRLRDRHENAGLRAVFLVGPEGGFTPAELERAVQSGFEPIGFPMPVLRAPTAVAVIGALGAVMGEAGAGRSEERPEGFEP